MIPIDGEILIHGREGSGIVERLGGRVGEGIQVVVVWWWGWSTWGQGDWTMVLGSHVIEKLEQNNQSPMF